MRVGIGLPNTLESTDRDVILEFAQRADEGPFTSLGVFDRIVYHSLDPLQTLGVCAGATDDIRLATSIVAGPLRSTKLLAKKAATLDVLSDGRLTLGVALGARKEDYDAAEADFGSRGRRFTKQLEEMRQVWEGDEIGPKPTREGGPQLLIGGESDPSYKRVARFGDGWIGAGGPPRRFERCAESATAAWNESGRSGKPALWDHGYFALGDEETAERGREYLLDYYAFTGPFAEKIADGLLTTKQEIVQYIRAHEERGCDELIMFPAVGGIDQYDKLERIVENEL
jgi:alkanesulfonate monooxygenase SsuD/methylene tetrahydromethanopterin reductase-like flavin-dependent oxidoreductase (luciferase family)